MKINYPAVVVAAVIHWISGAIWYGIFGSTFGGLMGAEKIKELELRSEAKAFILAFVSSLIVTYLLARFLNLARPRSLVDGLKVVFLLWLGFIATTQLLTVLFEARSLGLYLLNVGYQLVAGTLVTVILLIWQPRQAVEVLGSVQAQASAGA